MRISLVVSKNAYKHPFRHRYDTYTVRAAFFARATGQVGKQVADEGERVVVSRRCVKVKPWRALGGR
jgi:hypothetical protein